MIKRVAAEYKDLRGGVNQEVSASAIADNQHSIAVNWKPVGNRIRQRGGLRLLFTHYAPNGAREAVLGMRITSRNQIVGGVLIFGHTHATWVHPNNVSVEELGTIGSGVMDPWDSAAWNDSIFAAREADGLKIVQLADVYNGLADFVGDAGAPAPTEELIPAENTSSGDPPLLAAADYKWAYAWRDSRLGSTSSYGGVSATLTLGSAGQVDLSGFGTPPSARFDQIVIGRTLPNGVGAYYEIDVVDYEADLVYIDNIPIEQQGAALSSTNDVPPANTKSVLYWMGRIWLLTDRLVYPSGLLNPEAFSALDALEIGPDDSEFNVEFVPMPNRILVGKRRSLWAITGTGATSWEVRLVDGQRGVTSPRGMFYMNGRVYFKSDDDFYSTDGINPAQPLSGPGARRLAAAFAASDPNDAVPIMSVPASDGIVFGMSTRTLTRETEGL